MAQVDEVRVLYEQSQLPVFQNRMYDSEAEAKACPKGDMRLVEDLWTGLVYNQAFEPGLVQYDTHYQNEQGVSEFFLQHLRGVADIVGECLGRRSLVEVGCGKGLFLEMLQKAGFDITGFDPAYEGKNASILRQYFGRGMQMTANGLILRHVLEHIRNPFEFLMELKEANGGRGRIYIEVPCFDWICSHRAWFDVFYEHVNYFRVSDFTRLFNGIIRSGRLFGSQYLYIVADLAMLKKPALDMKDRVLFPDRFSAHFVPPIEETRPAVIWGGASKGVIFALLKERAGERIGAVIDINPAKQGKYLPATGILVQSPAAVLPELKKGSIIYVMNSNYLEEIREMSNNEFTYIKVDQ